MTNEDTIRAWKDSTYRATLTEEQILQLLPHPAGEIVPAAEIPEERQETPPCSVGMSEWCGCPPPL